MDEYYAVEKLQHVPQIFKLFEVVQIAGLEDDESPLNLTESLFHNSDVMWF